MEREGVGPAFAAALRRGREAFNARIAEAAASGGFDAGLFLASLRVHAAPHVEAAAKSDPACADALTEALFGLALAQARRTGGVFSPPADWSILMEAMSAHAAEAPSRVPTALFSALDYLDDAGARRADWVSGMLRAARLCPDAQAALAAGQAMAWLCGVAHFRDGALAALSGLPPKAAASLLQLKDPAAAAPALARLREDPWALPAAGRGGPPRVVHRVGGFRGFGGPFLAPPALRSCADAIFATDGQGWWRLHADSFGATLVPGDAPPDGEPAASPLSFELGGRVSREGRWTHLPELDDCRAWAAAGPTLAAAGPRSHVVRVVAWAEAAP